MKYISVLFLFCHSIVLAASPSIPSGKWYSQPSPSKLFGGNGCYQIELLENGTAFFRMLMLEESKSKIFQEIKGTYIQSPNGAILRFPDAEGYDLLLSLSDKNILIENPKAHKTEKYVPESEAVWAKPSIKAEQDAAANP